MNIFPEDFPDDLESKINQNIYKRGLPKIQKKMLHSTSQKTTLTAIKKLQQICNYKPFNKKSLENQELKLADLYTKYLLLLNSPSDSYSSSMIGEKNNKILKYSLNELQNYWSASNFNNYMCFIIQSVNFTSGNAQQKKIKNDKILDFLQDLYELNLMNDFVYFFEKNSSLFSNEEIHKFLCVIINDIKIKSDNTPLKLKKNNVIFNFIVSLNTHNLINKKIIDEIILDTVKNNRKKICKMLNEEFTTWLEY